MKMMRKLL